MEWREEEIEWTGGFKQGTSALELRDSNVIYLTWCQQPYVFVCDVTIVEWACSLLNLLDKRLKKFYLNCYTPLLQVNASQGMYEVHL